MEIDLLGTEHQCRASCTEDNNLHPEDSRVEGASGGDIGYGEHKVIQSVDIHCGVRSEA
jgi:hypothetical protein